MTGARPRARGPGTVLLAVVALTVVTALALAGCAGDGAGRPGDATPAPPVTPEPGTLTGTAGTTGTDTAPASGGGRGGAGGSRPRTRADFPGAHDTGVPAGVALASYDGPEAVTEPGTVIDRRRITGRLVVTAPGTVITRSEIRGNVTVTESGSLRIVDSSIDAGDHAGTGLEGYHFTAVRVHVVGGNRSMYCSADCTIRDSFVHGQATDPSGRWHESGIRMEQRARIIHNTITCDAPDVPPDGGCSAGLTGYGDFAAVRDNLVRDNLFLPTTGGACAYGGSSRGKPHTEGARGNRFVGNVFTRGASGSCGVWFAIADFDPAAPGNVWRDNVWDDGSPVRP